MARLPSTGRRCTRSASPTSTATTPTRVLVCQVLDAISQYERAVIRGRMMAGRAAKRASGGHSGGQPRYGTKAEGRQVAPNDVERRVVELITRARAAGKSYREICSARNRRAIDLAGRRRGSRPSSGASLCEGRSSRAFSPALPHPRHLLPEVVRLRVHRACGRKRLTLRRDRFDNASQRRLVSRRPLTWLLQTKTGSRTGAVLPRR